MQVGPGVYGPGVFGAVALGAAPNPAAVVGTPAVGRALDAAAHRAVDLAGTLGSHTGRLVRVVARGVIRVLRTRGPALVALVTAPRTWPGSPHLAVTAGRPRTLRVADDVPASAPQIPAPRSARRRPPPARRYELALPADATAPGQARGLLQDAVREWGVDDEVHQDAAMVVTELVANAVDHARTASTLTIELADDAMRVAVRDTRPTASLRPRPVDPTAPRGRGLQMIDALTRAWGVDCDVDGKTVWAVLPRA